MISDTNSNRPFLRKRKRKSRRRKFNSNSEDKVCPSKRKSRRRKRNEEPTKQELNVIEQEKARLVTWMKNLNDNNKDSFSKDWTLFVLTELALQCMGKLPIMKSDIPITIFNPKAAEKAIKLGAMVSGVLVDGMRGGSNGGNGYNPLQKQLNNRRNDEPIITEPKTDEERTREVYELLMNHGGVPKLEENKVIEIKAG